MNRMKNVLRSFGLTIGATIVITGIFLDSTLGQQQEVIGGGRYLFKKFCAPCHGPQAIGNGPKGVKLVPKPANLTILQKQNGGTFPFWGAYRMIDGRKHVDGHGTREMPVFGVWFRIPDDEVSIETEWADQVRGRIWQLLSFLKSIQVP